MKKFWGQKWNLLQFDRSPSSFFFFTFTTSYYLLLAYSQVSAFFVLNNFLRKEQNKKQSPNLVRSRIIKISWRCLRSLYIQSSQFLLQVFYCKSAIPLFFFPSSCARGILCYLIKIVSLLIFRRKEMQICWPVCGKDFYFVLHLELCKVWCVCVCAAANCTMSAALRNWIECSPPRCSHNQSKWNVKHHNVHQVVIEYVVLAWYKNWCVCVCVNCLVIVGFGMINWLSI